jgi:CBS domain-containing protein
MTKDPICALPDDSVADVARLMKVLDVGPVPIVESDENRVLVGIVTDRDLALKVVAQGLDPEATRAADVMTRAVVSCWEGENLVKALNAMANNQLRRIPVVDAEGCIVGIIAQADIATRVAEPEKTGELVKDISQ